MTFQFGSCGASRKVGEVFAVCSLKAHGAESPHWDEDLRISWNEEVTVVLKKTHQQDEKGSDGK